MSNSYIYFLLSFKLFFMFCELVFIYVTVQVQRINSADGKVKSVETDLGTVECQYFVNSAGQALNLIRSPFDLSTNNLTNVTCL